MKAITKTLKTWNESNINPKTVYHYLRYLDPDQIDISCYSEKDNTNTYQRIRIANAPMECLLMIWPPQAETAIHSHENYWGCIKVLEGEALEIHYAEQDGQLKRISKSNLRKGDASPEELNGIHQIKNNSKTNRLVTLHLYYPPKHGLEDTRLFDLANKRIGILNNKAKAASWFEPGTSFKAIMPL